MSTPKAAFALGACLALGAAAALAQSPGLGKPISEADINAWNIDVAPSGEGLPPGSGTGAQGAKVFAEKCAACHKADGTGYGEPGRGPVVGNASAANYVEHASTLFDFIRRAMPYHAPRTLTVDEVYALTAFTLARNKIIPDSQVMNAKTLPKVKMPNAGNFIMRFPDRI